ncbi:MAG: 3D domain-containing protein [Candidatus Yanofskybacteria bacterium]|nr:3D domain-containing protein [Candidatus Yanofskybacteria bacterium]
MNKKITKIMITILLLAFIAGISPVSANAAIFDWLKNDTLTEASSRFISFAGIGNGSGVNMEIEEDASPDFLILQGNSLLATNDPLSVKKTKKTENKTYVVPASAYSSTADQTDHTPFITAMGTHVRDGVVAANFLPFGTVIKIPEIYGDKTFVIEDRMNSRYFYKIDVWFPSRAQAKEFGVKNIKIEIVS